VQPVIAVAEGVGQHLAHGDSGVFQRVRLAGRRAHLLADRFPQLVEQRGERPGEGSLEGEVRVTGRAEVAEEVRTSLGQPTRRVAPEEQ